VERFQTWPTLAAGGVLLGFLAGCGGGGGGTAGGTAFTINTKPIFVGAITKTTYDGVTDDLLTGGLGKSGLQGASPTYVDPNNPTAAELRKVAIYNNYRALIDPVPAGGYGTLYGPNVDANGVATSGQGMIAGTEYLAFDDDGTGQQNVTMMVQVPNTFDKANPCIVTGTSSGSRGVYGAIGTAGDWGLKKGCAVAYTDKGSGMGVHDLQNNTVNLINGLRANSSTAGNASNFTAGLSASDLAAFNAVTPNRFAVKHAHGGRNWEKDWGKFTLDAIQFAYYVLNDQLGNTLADGTRVVTFQPGNTIVIASSASNGAGAALAAAEQDTQGLISGVAVSEPQIQLKPNSALTVQRGSVVMQGSGKGLLDYFTIANLYQPCAALAAGAAGSPGAALVNTARATNRCASLQAKGLLSASSTTTAAQAAEALTILQNAGWQPESALLHASHYALAVPPVAVTYAISYTKSSVKDNLCGFSFGATTAAGAPTTLANASLAGIFATGNGVPPTTGINIINNNSVGGPLLDGISVSPSTGVADDNIDGAICMRNLITGSSTLAQQAQASIAQLQVTGNLHGKPAIVVQGRSDTLVPIAFASRPYFGMNRIAEGAASKLSFIEVTNANHFDTFIDNAALPGYDSMLVPLHVYLVQALNMVYNNLKNGTPLPPSQLVRTVPRGGTPGAAPPITTANVPPISASPAAGDLITFSNNIVTIPN
jgi:hydroxybutyrate-dimer hydrolase